MLRIRTFTVFLAIGCLLLSGMFLVPVVSVDMDAVHTSAKGVRGEYVGYIENVNHSFTMPSSWSWHKVSVAAFVQDQTYHSATEQTSGYAWKSADVIQAAWHPLDGSTRSTGDERFVLFEHVGRAHCTYEPGALCSFDRIIDNSSYFPSKCVPIWWPYPNGQYATDDSNSRAGTEGSVNGGSRPAISFHSDGLNR